VTTNFGDGTDVDIRARVSDVLAKSDAGKWMVDVDVEAVPGDCTDVDIRARVSDVLAESDAGKWMVAVNVGAVPRFQAWSYQRQGTHKLPPLRSSV